MRRRLSRVAQLAIAALGASTLLINAGAAPAAANGAEFTLGGWQVVEFVQGQPACTGVGYEKQMRTPAKGDDEGFRAPGRVTRKEVRTGRTPRPDLHLIEHRIQPNGPREE